ncbi:NosD domain-containing protein [Methanoplanus limicola]|uniref:Polymorphic outer membrane protein n=1 Tax=Methanoplanus limicola DSM 2279 TaxID=937775 RepID=H1Z2L5_9EURY|nr:NosD domain-containing protein [Methanoplanus limicola]EHQ36418.1 polymorphic outer membrane protein [Methanoplanus limicola DSM 2279]
MLVFLIQPAFAEMPAGDNTSPTEGLEYEYSNPEILTNPGFLPGNSGEQTEVRERTSGNNPRLPPADQECTGNSDRADKTGIEKVQAFSQDKNSCDSLPYIDNRTVWYVDAGAPAGGDGTKEKPFQDIQTAADACNTSEKNTILIAYAGGAVYPGFSASVPDLIIMSESDVPSEYPVISNPDGTGAELTGDNIILCKLVITGCSGDDSEYEISGSAVFVHDSSGTEIKRCIIRDNSGYIGAGITFHNAEGWICGAEIRNNNASAGGGILIVNSSVYVRNATVCENEGYEGAGITVISGKADIRNSRIIQNNGEIGGGILSLFSECEIHYTNISGNTAENGAGVVLAMSESSVYYSDITSNSAANTGGGLVSLMSDTEVYDTDFSGNTADFGGGYLSRYGADTIRGSDFTGNKAVSGAGIALINVNSSVCGSRVENNIITAPDNTENLLSEDTSITEVLLSVIDQFPVIPAGEDMNRLDNLRTEQEDYTPYTGAGIYAQYCEDLTLKNNEIRDNIPAENITPAVAGGGVAVLESEGIISGNRLESNYADMGAGILSFNSEMEICGNIIENNNATMAGGGVIIASGSAIISENTISENNASLFGAGIVALTGKTEITDNTIEENNAGFGGGGICGIAAELLISENTVSSNTAGNGTPLLSGGGGLFIPGGIIGVGEINSPESISEFFGDEKSSLYTLDADELISEYTGRITVSEAELAEFLSGDLISGVQEKYLSDKLSSFDILNTDESELKPVLISNNTFCGNSAEISGGAVKTVGNLAFITNNDFSGNRAKRGGAAETILSLTLMLNNRIENNSAKSGGGLSLILSESINLGSEFNGNNATGFGGAALLLGSSSVFAGPYISENTAGKGGGGIAAVLGEVLIESGTITDNSASGNANITGGGGIFITDISAMGDDADDLPEIMEFSPYTADSAGIGRFISTTPREDEEDLFTDDSGSEILISEAFSYLILDLEITDNRADTGGGIAVLNTDSSYISGCNISGNRARLAGGGISLISANNTVVESSVIALNRAYGGDGIFIRDSHNFEGYDNLLLNRENIIAKTTESSPFEWNALFNITERRMFTITGSPYAGGNVWAEPDGTGISQTCTDADLDGICDSDTCSIYDNDNTPVGTDERTLYYNPEYGTLLVLTDPLGAEILLDKNSYGRKSPAGYYIPPGNYTADITLENYFDAPRMLVPVKTGDKEYIRYQFSDVPEFWSTGSGPLPLNFTAEITKFSPDVTAWNWYITMPDGSVNTYSKESISAVFDKTGNYNVTLEAVWSSSKITKSETKRVLVTTAPPKPKASEKASSEVNGTKTEVLPDGSQMITVNETLAGNVTTTGSGIIIDKPDGTRINIKTNETPGRSGGNITGKVTSVTMEQPPLNADLGEGLGNASVGVSVTMDGYNGNAGLTTEISSGCADDARNAFSIACPEMTGVAYTVYFTKTGFDNSSAIKEAVLNFSVNTTWVDSMGGPQRITIIRWKDDGSSENIRPDYLGVSGTESLFQVKTDGFSVYGIAGFTPSPSPSDSSSGDNPVCIKDMHDLKAGSVSATALTGTAFTEIAITPAKDISDLRITAEEMNYPGAGMGVPEDARVFEYIKTTLYYTTASSLEKVEYTAKIPKEWLDNNNSSLPAVWYYNESAGVWNKAEVLVTGAEDGYTFTVFEAEMPGFGWFAAGGIPAELILGNETLPFGPGPEITSEEPAESVTPASPTATPAEPAGGMKGDTPVPTATPLSVLVVVSGIFMAAGVFLYKKRFQVK